MSTVKTVTPSAIATLIQSGKSAEGRIRKIMDGAFSAHDVTLKVGGKKDQPTVTMTAKGRRYDADATKAQGISAGDASAWSAYQALLRLSEYLEVSPDSLGVATA